MHYVAEQGVTSVHHMGTWDDLDVVRARAASADALTTRIYAAVPLDTWERLRDTVAAQTYGGADGRGDDWLRVGGLKGFVDGSLGSHTAAFHEPFNDAPKDRGLLRQHAGGSLHAGSRAPTRPGLHVMVHAIGDRANGLLLDIYERVERENGPRDRRFRIEHAQHLAPADIPRFAHARRDRQHAAVPRDRRRPLGRAVHRHERIKTTYAFRSLLDAGARLAFGSDWFVAPPTPLEGIYAAVTRRTLDGKQPGRLGAGAEDPVEEALRAYTRGGAYASFEERRRARSRRACSPTSSSSTGTCARCRPRRSGRRG